MDRYKQLQTDLKLYKEKTDRLSWANDQLRKDLFGAHQRINGLAIAFGFNNYAEVQALIAAGELDTRACRCPICPGAHKSSEKETESEPEASSSSQISALQNQLKQLQDKYDALLSVKERAAARYKSDYQKWKNFKQWLFEDDKRARHFVRKERGRRKEQVKNGVKSPKKGADVPEDTPDKTLVNPPKPEEDVTELLDDLSDASSATEDDSQAPEPTSSFDMNAYLRSDVAKSNRKKRRISEIEAVDCSTPIKDAKAIRRRTPSPRKASTHEQPVYSTPTKRRPLADTTREQENTPTKPKKTSSSVGFAGSGSTVKGKEQPSTPADADTTINALFEINTEQNGGVNYQFSAVVRNKEERRHLKGGDCECCRDYYEGVGPLPTRPAPPLWNDQPLPATPSTSRHRNEISKHRHHWAAPRTPPGYWDIGFPDTQEAADINERARDLQREKMKEVEKEAGREGGMYKRRR
ncbi:hypothetical protein GLOTRDRAFT_120220 [Gloeophyllum trabeum ATCC 11539]|uniref:DNA endonuclease activator Ctp1 C-terminal domain-containing protein n=1 Tax=Gloeophyllum trabeum (strain ATCC 11539 / FP-39264 / Madison 617) TaxID=670483 RepID=S7RUW4_GLOTA|nr:uncharacterized protein GLOTRDRAFT_120220 [Gloeophyllum trabeum ATCC 11539]EPQ58530.1 hypothetical protein GLOTRDRAFT_120220 [Gloeophyllum trabeum ATCC 11539]